MSPRVHVSAGEPCCRHPAVSLETALRSGAGLMTRAFVLKSSSAEAHVLNPRNRKLDRSLSTRLYKYHDTLKSPSLEGQRYGKGTGARVFARVRSGQQSEKLKKKNYKGNSGIASPAMHFNAV